MVGSRTAPAGDRGSWSFKSFPCRRPSWRRSLRRFLRSCRFGRRNRRRRSNWRRGARLLTPAATRAVDLFLAYSLLFLITIQRIRAVDDVERLLRWIAFAAVLMAIFGLVQFFASNGKFFWFYEHPYSKTNDIVKGGFTNRNHFAHFLALGVGPLVWWIQHAWRQQRKHSGCQFAQHSHEISSFRITEGFRILAFSIVMFAVLLSLSRGGALVTLLAVIARPSVNAALSPPAGGGPDRRGPPDRPMPGNLRTRSGHQPPG